MIEGIIDKTIAILRQNEEIYKNRINDYSERIKETRNEIQDLAEDLVNQRASKNRLESEKRSKESDET